ncbi:MAG: lipopolysaccharide biosynthesis protein [Alistipes sp.]|jgi:O-antigen/teichoic acid export membrane protein|nr:lipopolysaccharide biosynthesis protein [Alistipes sp.]
MAELKKKVVRGFAWNVAEKVASALFQAWVVVNILNRVAPGEYALKAILAAFVAVFNVFVDSGFSQALIRNKNATSDDYSSAFWFNLGISALVYAVLVALMWPMARFFGMPDLMRFAPVFFLIIPFGAVGIIQQTVMTREFDFRRLSTIFFASTVGSGLLGVALAFAGFGFWAIVGQRVAQTFFRSALLWMFGRWRPVARFSGAAIRAMFGFSSRLLATDLLNNLFANVPNLIIGRVAPRDTLGFYDQARSLRDLPVNSSMTAMQSVTFPALASIRENDEKFARSVGRVVGSIVFLMFPIMAGMTVVADEIFGVFLKAEWWASVPFFRILCLAGLFTPLAVISSNILRTRSDGRAVLRAEIVKKILAVGVLAVTIPMGVVAIAWGVVAIAFGDAAVSFVVARRESAYGLRALGRDVLPTLGLTAVMAGAVWLVGVLLGPAVGSLAPKIAMGMVLAAKIFVGVGVYLGGAALLRLAAFGEFMEVVKKIAGKIK